MLISAENMIKTRDKEPVFVYIEYENRIIIVNNIQREAEGPCENEYL